MKKEVKRRKDEGNFLERYKKSFFHAVDGIVYAIEKEHNMIIMMIAAILVFVVALIIPVSLIEVMILLILIVLVIACEMINSAIEAVVDLITLEEHPLAKVAKDLGSAASLLLSVLALICGIIIFLPKILALF